MMLCEPYGVQLEHIELSEVTSPIIQLVVPKGYIYISQLAVEMQFYFYNLRMGKI
jgi:hypothetical protein